MFIVRMQSMSQSGGASYLVEASKSYTRKYRWGKTIKMDANLFHARRTAQTWAKRLGGKVVEL